MTNTLVINDDEPWVRNMFCVSTWCIKLIIDVTFADVFISLHFLNMSADADTSKWALVTQYTVWLFQHADPSLWTKQELDKDNCEQQGQ